MNTKEWAALQVGQIVKINYGTHLNMPDSPTYLIARATVINIRRFEISARIIQIIEQGPQSTTTLGQVVNLGPGEIQHENSLDPVSGK